MPPHAHQRIRRLCRLCQPVSRRIGVQILFSCQIDGQPEQRLLGLSFDMLVGGEKAGAPALRAVRAVVEACSSRVDPAFNNILGAKSASVRPGAFTHLRPRRFFLGVRWQ